MPNSNDAGIRLAVYGTLAPGRPNHHQLAGLEGQWRKGMVRGRLVEGGWGSALGYPGLILDAHGDAIEVQLFESPDLPAHWQRLDEFEGSGYRRVTVAVALAGETLPASIYVLAA
ncbi:gamma-glutamylcyclotransferase [Sphingomonas oleivorans]|uniref:Gamma-glutamylcyclotransferase n=2 Tax=Sphingomonas oleivorans TaxID=1735121 RepID=A0A2T5G0B6_9SPHN|nr:gamma-glutamylcyclotransferase [Sphingomonas oleivorans]